MSDNARITKTAGMVGALTILSRLLGYLRDIMIAGFFGAGLFSDVFIAAFRIPSFMRRLFSEGALSMAFIPVFSMYLKQEGTTQAVVFAGAAFRFLFVVLGAGVLVGLMGAPLLVYGVAPGFAGLPEKYNLTLCLIRIMLPYIFFIGIVGFCMGVLNVLDHFVAPALAPSLLNLSMIFSMFLVSLVSTDDTVRVIVLSFGVIVGGGAQLLLQLWVLIKKRIGLFKRGPCFHPGIKKVAVMMVPAIFGVSVFQINVLLDTLLASLLAEGAISYLYYADRLVQFPLGVFAVSIATAMYPKLSHQAVLKDMDQVKETVNHALKLVFFVSLPSTIGLIVLREPIVALLFKRGAFDAETTRLTASALLYYGIGVWAFSAVRITVSALYALNDAWTPVKAGLIAIGVNIVLGLFLMQTMSYAGLALATSLASMLNLWILAKVLEKKTGPWRASSLVRSIGGSVGCTLIMGAVVHGMVVAGETSADGLFFRVGGCVLTGVLVYAALSYVLNRETMVQALEMLKGVSNTD